MQKRQNRSRCRSGADSCWSKEPCIGWGLDPSREGELFKGGHIPADNNMPTNGECAVQLTLRMNAFADKTTMWSLAILLCTIVINLMQGTASLQLIDEDLIWTLTR